MALDVSITWLDIRFGHVVEKVGYTTDTNSPKVTITTSKGTFQGGHGVMCKFKF